MISIVVPNYNSGALLAKNLPKLENLLKKSGLEYEIIISDDASTDDSVVLLTGLHLVMSLKNTGFGMCVDRGIKAAKGEIVFVLNAADILPESADFFKIMLKHFEDPKVFSVAAVKKDETGEHGRGIIIFFRGFYLHFHSHDDYKKWLLTMRTTRSSSWSPKGDRIFSDMTTAWADGGSQAIRKNYYEKIGGFNPFYFLYWEDVDLGFRAWKSGYKIIYEPLAILIHQKNEGPISKRFTEKQIYRLNLRNQIYFTWKNSDLKHKLLFLFWFPYHFAVAIKNLF